MANCNYTHALIGLCTKCGWIFSESISEIDRLRAAEHRMQTAIKTTLQVYEDLREFNNCSYKDATKAVEKILRAVLVAADARGPNYDWRDPCSDPSCCPEGPPATKETP